MVDHLVLLAAGRGTRMDPLTRTRPKVLLPVAGDVLAAHVLRAAQEAGFKRASIVVHAGADQVRAAFADRFGLEVDFIDQEQARGTGHAVGTLADHVDDEVVVASGDAVLDASDLKKLRQASPVAVAGARVADAGAYGRLKVEQGRVVGIEEKPRDGQGGIVNAGAYHITPAFAQRCRTLAPSPRGELEVTDALAALAAEDHPAHFVETPSWAEAGRPWDLLDLQARLGQSLTMRIDGDVGERVDIVGPVVVAKGATVLNGTRIEGPAWIGPGAKVGPHAYIRPTTHIGAGCHIGASVEVKNSIIGDGSHVPHLSYVGDSVIGAGCNLGAGTQVANLKHSDHTVRVRWQDRGWLDTRRRKLGTIMGDDVKTGVNSSIDPGTVLCPGARILAGASASGWVEPGS